MLPKTNLIKITSIISITTFVLATVFAFSKNTENSFSIKSTKVDIKAILEQNTNFNITSVSTTRGSLNDLVIRGRAKNNLQKEKQLV
jgi:cell division protein FtsX